MTLFREVRSAAEGLARLASKALSREELTLAHTSLLCNFAWSERLTDRIPDDLKLLLCI
jgi:hypothetical protein